MKSIQHYNIIILNVKRVHITLYSGLPMTFFLGRKHMKNISIDTRKKTFLTKINHMNYLKLELLYEKIKCFCSILLFLLTMYMFEKICIV